MRLIMEFSGTLAAGWILSNILFVLGWCWLHSPNRPWMNAERRPEVVFRLHRDSRHMSVSSQLT
jgi:hypothetical protein